MTDLGTGRYLPIFSIPFKSENYAVVTSCDNIGGNGFMYIQQNTQTRFQVEVTQTIHSGVTYDTDLVYVVFFGELENE